MLSIITAVISAVNTCLLFQPFLAFLFTQAHIWRNKLSPNDLGQDPAVASHEQFMISMICGGRGGYFSLLCDKSLNIRDSTPG